MVTPTVSVVIPVYRVRYLRAAIDSVLAQTFGDYEIIVVDDGSPDRVEIEAVPIADGDRLQLVRQENQGPSAARNAGIRAARGTFVAFLDADDTWEPPYLAEQMAAITRGGGWDLVFCWALMMGQSEAERRALTGLAPVDGLVTCTSVLRDQSRIFLSGVVARRQAVMDAGAFDVRFKHAEDFDLWLRMLKMGARMQFQRHALLNRRLHADSLSNDVVTHDEKALLVLETFRRRADLSAVDQTAAEWRIKSIQAELAIERAKRAVARRDFQTATQALKDANEFYRSWKLRMVRFLLRCCPALIAHAHDVRQRRRMARADAPAQHP